MASAAAPFVFLLLLFSTVSGLHIPASILRMEPMQSIPITTPAEGSEGSITVAVQADAANQLMPDTQMVQEEVPLETPQASLAHISRAAEHLGSKTSSSQAAIQLLEKVLEPRAVAPKVLYAVMTDNANQPILQAQIETWAAELVNQGRFFATTGADHERAEKSVADILHRVSCPDAKSGVVCKEAHILEVGFAKSAEWLVRVDDDSYVDTGLLERALSSLAGEASQGPVVLGIALGCGKDIRAFCPKVTMSGGICGGGGYALNRAAISMLQSVGWSQMLQEYTSYYQRGIYYGDIVTSCVLMDRGMEIRQLYGGAAVNRVTKLKSWQSYVDQRPLTYHHLETPAIMHWLHAKLGRVAQEHVTALEAQAFEKGCCCWLDEKQKHACQSGLLQEPAPARLSGSLHSPAP